MNCVSKRWWRTAAPLYRLFSMKAGSLDFSERAAVDMFRYESTGEGKYPNPDTNGFANGKKFMGVTVDMWREDIRDGQLTKAELLEDPAFAELLWWLRPLLETINRDVHYMAAEVVL